MGWLTTSREEPTLRIKARNRVASAWSRRGGAVCEVCRKPIAGSARRATHHARCAARVVLD